MKSLPVVFDGSGYESSYAGIHAEMLDAVDRVNGRVLAPDGNTGQYFPRLSNLQVAALVQAWRRATQRAGSAPVMWKGWYDLLTAAFGWEKQGDTFDDSAEHMKAQASPELVRMFWLSTDQLARDLDGDRVALRALRPQYTRAEYNQAERDAWEQMRGTGIIPPDLGPPLRSAADGAGKAAAPIAPPSKASGGGGLLVLLIALAIALESK